MNIGMLWYDNEKGRPLAEKVQRAVEYYQRKYRQAPNCCHVHPAENLPEAVGAIRIIPNPYTLPNHLWVGVEAEKERA